MVHPHPARMQSRFVFALTVLVLSAFPSAALEPASHFSDHMVLQRDANVPVWGKAEKRAMVKVSFAGQNKSTKANKAGEWRLQLDPLKASSRNRSMTISSAGKAKTIENVLVGEVWVGSGQSNMAGQAGRYAAKDHTLKKLIASAPYPSIRLMRGGPKPVWEEASEANVSRFSALAISFGEALHRQLDVPVGLIVGAVGGTPSHAWMPEEIFENSERCKKEIAEFAKTYDAVRAQKQHEAKLAAFEKAAAKAKAEGKKVRGRKPRPPVNPGESTRGGKTGGLFDRFIRSSSGYAIRGVLWDQGEAGSGILGLGQYSSMTELIRGWRELWGQGDFPFLFVQKPSGMGNAFSKKDPITREANAFTKALPDIRRIGVGKSRYIYTRLMLDNENAWMVPASDLGPQVHPINKWGYGNRAAQIALQKVYGTDIQAYGPVYASHRIEGDKVRVTFNESGAGLVAAHADSAQGFALSSDDGKWHWAKAKIAGKNSVVLSSGEVKKPKHVRYAYSGNRTWANLFNMEGLPALSFTTEEVDLSQR